jgi:hypothetical protein
MPDKILTTAWMVCYGGICDAVDGETRGKAKAAVIAESGEYWEFEWNRLRAYRRRAWDGLLRNVARKDIRHAD